MTRKTNDVGGRTARSYKGIATLNNISQTTTVQERLEGGNAADALAALVTRLQIAQAFDGAEARDSAPEPLSGYFPSGVEEFAVEGRGSSGEWLVAEDIGNSVANLEVWR